MEAPVFIVMFDCGGIEERDLMPCRFFFFLLFQLHYLPALLYLSVPAER